MAGVNYFFRRIASPDRLPIGGRCLTVIVTGSNNLGGSDGEETQWIGTSGTDCGGSRSVFDQRAVCEAGDSARVFGDHWLPPKVGDPNLERQWWRQGSGFEHYCRYSFHRSSAMDIWSSIRRHESNVSQSAPRRLIGCWLTREDYATDGE